MGYLVLYTRRNCYLGVELTWVLRCIAVCCVAWFLQLLYWEPILEPMKSSTAPIPLFAGEEGFHPQLIHISAGSYLVGDVASRKEDDQDKLGHNARKVQITYDFLIMSTELSERIAAQLKPSLRFSQGGCMGDCPLSQVSWYEALELANLLSEKTGLEPCYQLSAQNQWPKGVNCLGYRLPLEEEWEYVAKAGIPNIVYASDSTELNSIAWYQMTGQGHTHPIAKKEPNSLGLYDLFGNVNEWCWDRWKKTSKQENNQRVIRGGAWDSTADVLHSEHRSPLEATVQSPKVGVRFVRTLP